MSPRLADQAILSPSIQKEHQKMDVDPDIFDSQALTPRRGQET